MIFWRLLILVYAAFSPFSAQADLAADKEAIECFLKSGEVVSIAETDLDRDGVIDLLVTTDKDGQRTLSLLYREFDGSFREYVSSNKALLCRTCGGAMGDPLVSIETRQNKIRIEHFSGSAWRNSHVALFEYNDENREWYLAELQTASFHASNPDDIRESLLLHGDQLDYLSLQDYDIDKSPAEQIN